MFVEEGVEVDLHSRSVISSLVGRRVRVHRVNVVVLIVHHDHLRITSLSPRSNVFPNQLRSNLPICRLEMVLKTGLIIVIGLPNHPFSLGMSVSEMPVSVIVNIELSLSIFDDSVGIVNT